MKEGQSKALGNAAKVSGVSLGMSGGLGNAARLDDTFAGMIEAMGGLANGNGRKRNLSGRIARRAGTAGVEDRGGFAGNETRAGSGGLFGAGEALHD